MQLNDTTRTGRRLRLTGLCLVIATCCLLTPNVALAQADEGGWSWQLQWLGALLNVTVIAFVIWRFGAPGMRKFLARRKESIDSDIAEAETLRAQAEARLDELEQRIATLDAERQKVLDEYRAIGESERAHIVAQAQRDAERIRRDAQSWSETELSRTRHLVERQITTRALELAEEKLRGEMQPARQKALVDQAIHSLTALGDGKPAAPTGRRGLGSSPLSAS